MHLDKSSDPEAIQLRSLLDSFGMEQHVDGPTHIRGHTLDLVISHATDNLVQSCEMGSFVSDHNAINIALKSGHSHPIKKQITFRKFKAIVMDNFITDIKSSSLVQSLPSEPDEIVSSYNHVLQKLLDKHAPLQTRAVAHRPLQPWMNNKIIEARRLHRKAEKLYRKDKSSVRLRQSYKQSCERVTDLIVKAKKSYFIKRIDDCESDQKKLFQIVDKLLGRGKSATLPEHSDACSLAESFNEFFVTKISRIQTELSVLESSIDEMHCSPVHTLLKPASSKLHSFEPTTLDEITCIIKKASKSSCNLDPIPTNLLLDLLPALAPVICALVNVSLSTGTFPTQLKSAIVLPLLKKPGSDQNVMKHYRPVSNLSFISKVIERVVASRLLDHMVMNDLLDPFQSAYRKGHSTETAIVHVHNDIVSAVDKGNGVCLVLLDLSADFDTVDHTILCTFLEDFIGLEGPALNFFKTYLTGRTQCVSVKGVLSELSELMFGVPQGSELGPLIFCIYTLPLSTILKHYKIDYHIYADDTQLYCTFEVDSLDDVLTSLCSCISDISSWMIKNKLKINDDKTEFLLVTSPYSKFTKDIQISIGQHNIAPSSSCKSHGVMLDEHFSMDTQISSICRSTHFHIRNIGTIRDLLPTAAAAQLVPSLVTSRLDYCNALLLGIPAYKIQRLQRMHNIAARVVARPDRDHDIDEVLESLHWLPVKYRILYKVLIC